MVRLLLINDVHLADKPPSLRTESYATDLLAKLRWSVAYGKEQGCVAVVQLGDIFHVKRADRTSHKLVQSTADALTSAGLPVYILPGNHDLQHDRLETIPSQPIGTLCKAEGIDLLMGAHPTLPLYGLPYQADWSKLPELLETYRLWAEEQHFKDMSWIPLLLSHAPIFPKGQEPPYEYISAEDWAEMMQVGDCQYAHIHDPHGIYRTKVPTVTMCNPGALSRGSLHEHTLRRKPTITVWDSEVVGERFTLVEVPHKPAEEVFRLDLHEAKEERESRVSEFLEEVGQVKLENLTVEEVVAHAESMDLDQQVLQELRSVIEEVSSR